MKAPRFGFQVLILLALCGACGEDDVHVTRCDLDESLLDSNTPCVEDENCPCGTGCSVGRCAAECRRNSDCNDGDKCDDFGRCVISTADYIAPPSRSAEEAPVIVTVSTPLLLSRDGSQARRFTVSLGDPSTSATFVRIVPEAGLKIDCGGPLETSAAQATSEACEVELTDIVEVTVVPEQAFEPGASASLSVYWNDERRDVSYYYQVDSVMAFDPIGAPTGHYKGFATLSSVGAGFAPPDAPTPEDIVGVSGGKLPAADVSVPLEMDIFEDGTGGYLVQVSEPFGAIFPSKAMVAALRDPGDGTMRWMAETSLSFDSTFTTITDDPFYNIEENRFDHLDHRFGWRQGTSRQSGSSYTMDLDAGVFWAEVDTNKLSEGIFLADIPMYFDTHSPPQRVPGVVWSLALTREGAVDGSTSTPVPPSGTADYNAAIGKYYATKGPSHWTDSMAQKIGTTVDHALALAGLGNELGLCINQSAILIESDPDYREYSEEMATRVLALRLFGVSGTRVGATNSFGSVRVDGSWARSNAHPHIAAITRTIRNAVGGVNLPSEISEISGMEIDVGFDRGIEYTNNHMLQRIPCNWRFNATYAKSPFSVPVAVSENRCAELSELTGCEIVAEGRNTMQSLPAGTLLLSNNSNGNVDGTWAPSTASLVVDQVCILPEMPLGCIDAIQCHSGESIDGLSSSPLIASFYSATGDAVCEGAFRSMAVDADDNTHGLSAGAMFQACVDDLSNFKNPSPAGESLRSALSNSPCFNLGRFFLALETATSVARELRFAPSGRTKAPSFHTAALRLFGRWVEAHGYIAREMTEQQALAKALELTPVIGQSPLPAPEDVLTTSLTGWELFFHQRFAHAIDRIPGAYLAKPDYREEFFPNPNGGSSIPSNVPNSPARGLPSIMLETWRAQVDLSTSMVEHARYRHDLSVLDRLGPLYRYGVIVDSLAEELASRAVLACESDVDLCGASLLPPWYDEFKSSRVQLDIALGRLATAVDNLITGRNPLGIEDDDMPLYFADDPETDAGRFFAISDYLVGSSPQDVGAWAPALIETAALRLDAVRAKWVERQDREVATERDVQARETRIIATQVDYGERLLSLCGRPGNLLPGDVLTNWEAEHGRPFNATNCYVDQKRPSCIADRDRSFAIYTPEEARFSVCQFQELIQLGVSATYVNRQVEEVATNCPHSAIEYGSCSDGSCLSCNSGGLSQAPLGSINDLLVDVPDIENIDALLAATEATCIAAYPTAVVPLPTTSDIDGGAPAGCFRGSIGEQAAALRAVNIEIDIARQELTEQNDAYLIAMDACLKAKATGLELIEAQERLNANRETLRIVKLAADIAASVAESVSDCAGHVNDIDADAAAPKDVATAKVGCAAELVQAAAEAVSFGMDFAIAQAEDAFELETQEIEVGGAFALCQIEATQYTVASGSQALRIRAALATMDAAMVAMQNLITEANSVYVDGLATVDFEVGRRLNPLNQDLWIDEEVAGFTRAFSIAKRVTYLAAIAVEYEFQQSLRIRDQVLMAELPTQLRDALTELRTLTGARSIGGSRPVARKVILSLRDDLLGLGDLSDVPANFHEMTPTERLRNRLVSKQVFDAEGEYIGHEITFSLAPTGVGISVPGTREVFSQSVCAERLWSVNASILGGSDLLFENDSTFTELVIKKSNTFYSQWCGQAPDDQEFQSVSVRPERNLFRDPTRPSPDFIETQLAPLQGELMAKALIQPSLNVPREEFEDDQFENGASSQLAGRGLFGEYSIFFPVQALSTVVAGQQRSGLDLSKVDDVLIRFDYVGAAQ